MALIRVDGGKASNLAYLFYVNGDTSWGVYELNANPSNPTKKAVNTYSSPISIFGGIVTCDEVAARQPRVTLVDTTKTVKVLNVTGISAYGGYSDVSPDTLQTLDSVTTSIGGTNAGSQTFVAIIYIE